MSTYAVIRKADSVEVYRYLADAPIEWTGFEFALFDHVLQVEPVSEPPAPQPQEWTAVEFLRRFTAAERITARAARKTDTVLDDFYALLEQAPVVHSIDPDVALGLGYMTQQGYLAVGRAAEILGSA